LKTDTPFKSSPRYKRGGLVTHDFEGEGGTTWRKRPVTTTKKITKKFGANTKSRGRMWGNVMLARPDLRDRTTTTLIQEKGKKVWEKNLVLL